MGERESKGQKREAPGSGTSGFFTDVVNGSRDVPSISQFSPLIKCKEIEQCSNTFNKVGLGHFDWHIYCSIPTFYEMQRGVVYALFHALKNLEEPVVLDLGASEGILCKSLSLMSEGHVKSISLDPNFAMKRRFDEGLHVQGASFVHAAISHDHDSPPFFDEGVEVPYYAFNERFDCIIEIMLFQFLGHERTKYITKISQCLKADGIFICCEKFSSYDSDYYADNEVLKDEYKLKWFSKEEIEKKFNEILDCDVSPMSKNQVYYEDMESMLKENFTYVVSFWDAGNFKGYVCSNTEANLQNFLYHMPNLNSPFSTFETPYFV